LSQFNGYITTQVGSCNSQVEKVSYSDTTAWIDNAKTRGFRSVPEEVWNFHIGGYQVCEKWLKDRQAKGGKDPRPGRVLTAEDIDHYQKIVVAISATIRIMAEIDEVIDQHGGWPDAFASGPSGKGGGTKTKSSGKTVNPAVAKSKVTQTPDIEPWQITRGEFHQLRVLQGFTDPQENTRLYWQGVEKARAEGKRVPPHVLREYEQLFGRRKRH
jgi:hypothetical protein